jgi:hypothetical protein
MLTPELNKAAASCRAKANRIAKITGEAVPYATKKRRKKRQNNAEEVTNVNSTDGGAAPSTSFSG